MTNMQKLLANTRFVLETKLVLKTQTLTVYLTQNNTTVKEPIKPPVQFYSARKVFNFTSLNNNTSSNSNNKTVLRLKPLM